jgi:hypothetical protein
MASGQIMQLHIVDRGVAGGDGFSGVTGAERDNGYYPKIK